MSACSLPQRIRAGCDVFRAVTAGYQSSLPQRIRAGCDPADSPVKACTFLCHSAFARVATIRVCMVSLDELLCHSAFARVATIEGNKPLRTIAFATAHSRGLRRVRQAYVQQAHSFATAHSRGLRLSSAYFYWSEQPLPQRIRAGCDACYPKACSFDFALPQRIRAGCDLDLGRNPACRLLCHSAFARVATQCLQTERKGKASLPQRIRAGCDTKKR